MIQLPPRRVLRPARLLGAACLLAGAVAVPLSLTPAHAANGPRLTLRCFGNAKVKHQVSCWTWGNNYTGSEWVHFTYQVTFLIPSKKPLNLRPSLTFRRTVKTDDIGTLSRTPRVTFMLPATRHAFKVLVTGVGARKDTGTTSLVGMGY